MTSKNGAEFSLKTGLCPDNEAETGIKAGVCPDDSKLAGYISGSITSKSEKERIAAHVAECDACFKKVASCLCVMHNTGKGKAASISNSCLRRILSMPRKYPNESNKRGFLRRNTSLFIGLIFFVLSFIFKPYFLQFLAAAIILGLKWITDTGSTRALIMIYDTWRHAKRTENSQANEDTIGKRRL